MSDDAITNANAQKDELAKQINRLTAELEDSRRALKRVEQFISDWHIFAGVQPEDNTTSATEEKTVGKVTPLARARELNNPKKDDVVARVRIFIGEKGEPVSRNEAFADLEANSFEIRGTDPKMVLSTMLWRSKDQVVRLKLPNGRNAYWLTEQPYPPAGYVPGVMSDSAADQPEAEPELPQISNDL
jgi:hypothetical protein